MTIDTNARKGVEFSGNSAARGKTMETPLPLCGPEHLVTIIECLAKIDCLESDREAILRKIEEIQTRIHFTQEQKERVAQALQSMRR